MFSKFTEELFNLSNESSKQVKYDTIKRNNAHVMELLRNELIGKKHIDVVGKGPSAIYIEDAHAANQSIIMTNKKFLYILVVYLG